jgi:CheY-like chemotaxis protein
MELETGVGRGTRLELIAPLRDPYGERPQGDVDSASTEVTLPVLGSDAEVAQVGGGPIRVLLADDHPVVRKALGALLGDEPDIEVVGEVSDGRAAVESAGQLLPDVIVMDFSMPGMDGIEATRVIHARLPSIRIIGLSMYPEADRSAAMIDAGADAYISKREKPDALLRAIRKVVAQRA